MSIFSSRRTTTHQTTDIRDIDAEGSLVATDEARIAYTIYGYDPGPALDLVRDTQQSAEALVRDTHQSAALLSGEAVQTASRQAQQATEALAATRAAGAAERLGWIAVLVVGIWMVSQ